MKTPGRRRFVASAEPKFRGHRRRCIKLTLAVMDFKRIQRPFPTSSARAGLSSDEALPHLRSSSRRRTPQSRQGREKLAGDRREERARHRLRAARRCAPEGAREPCLHYTHSHKHTSRAPSGAHARLPCNRCLARSSRRSPATISRPCRDWRVRIFVTRA